MTKKNQPAYLKIIVPTLAIAAVVVAVAYRPSDQPVDQPLHVVGDVSPSLLSSPPITLADTLNVSNPTDKPPSTVEVLKQATVEMDGLAVQAQALTAEYSLQEDVDELNALLAQINMPEGHDPIAPIDAESISYSGSGYAVSSTSSEPLRKIDAHFRTLNAEMDKVRETLSSLETQ